jgi:hypothetical protein
MTHGEALQRVKRLRRISDSQITDVNTWLALVEDELQSSIPKSRLLERFEQVKADREKAIGVTNPTDGSGVVVEQPRSQFQEIIQAACERLESEPMPKEDLTEEIDRIIQKGYFKSVYFRAVLGGLALVLVLVTGIEGYRLGEQVKAMQKMVDDARQQVEQSRLEVAKAAKETQDNEGKLALMVLQGDKEMVEIRTKTLSQIDEEGFADRAKVDERAKHWTDEIDKNGAAAGQQIDQAGEDGKARIAKETNQATRDFDASVIASKQSLKGKLTLALERVEAQRTPWVPRVLWSFAKAWILVPLAAIIAVLALFTSLSTLANADRAYIKSSVWVKTVAIANTVIVLGLGGALVAFWFRG